MESFEQKINDAVSNAVGLPSAMIDYYDAIKIAREADTALAAVTTANQLYHNWNEYLKTEALKLLALIDEVGTPDGDETDRVFARYEFEGLRNAITDIQNHGLIKRLTDLNTAKSELIDFYTNYINSLNGYLSTHQMSPSEAQVEYGNRLRARIRSLENE